MQIEFREVVAKEKGSQTNTCISQKINMPWNNIGIKGSATCNTGTGKPGLGEVAMKYE